MSALSEHLTRRWAIPAEEAGRIAAAMEAHSAAEAPAVPETAREGGGPVGPPEPPQAAAPAPPEDERLSDLLRRARRLKPDMERWGEDLY